MSEKWKLNLEEVKSLAWTTLLMGAGTMLTYLMDHLATVHLSDTQLLVVSLFLGLALKVVQKLQQGR